MKKLFVILIMLVFSLQAYTQNTGPPGIVPALPSIYDEAPQQLTLPNPMKVTGLSEEFFMGPGDTGIMIVLYNDYNYYPLITGKIKTSAINQLFINPDIFGQLIHYTEIGYSVWNR